MTSQPMNEHKQWTHPLQSRSTVSQEMGETTPFVFKNRLYRIENWQKFIELPGSDPGERFMEDQVRIWDVESKQVVSIPLTAHSFGIAYVHNGRAYVFAARHEADRPWRHFRFISMTSSDDLVNWTAPVTVIEAEEGEGLFNTAVCHDGRRFVLLYETDDRRWPKFTFKYCESHDLIHWRRIRGAIYGREKYVGGPALYFEGEWFYTLYLQDLGGSWETRVTRSRDLLYWEDAPEERPFLAPDKSRVFTYHHFGRQVEVQEINASDAEICYWQGKTLVYFNGGDQQTSGDLQQAEFDGTPRELLERFYEEPAVTLPSPRQLSIQERQFGAFIHFGMATWYDGVESAVFPSSLRQPYAFNLNQWGSMLAQPPASAFNPMALDATQWVSTAKGMGAKHIVLTAKHHNGFCLWPTKTTEYCVRNSPWQNGKGDVLREFADATRQAGLGVGLYFSAADINAGCFSTPEPQGQRRLIGDLDVYLPIIEKQFEELLCGYGELCEIWLDAALDPLSPDVRRLDGSALGSSYWNRLVDLAQRLQPGAVIMGGSRPDLRWTGNEEGLAPYPLWYVVEPGQESANWVPDGAAGWLVPEADVFTRPSWFWTPGSDSGLKNTEQLLNIYYRSVGNGASLLINLTPDNCGLIPDKEVKLAASLGAELQNRFGKPIAQTNSEERWGEGNTLDLDLGGNLYVNHVVLEENIRYGQRIRAYSLEAYVNGTWQKIATGASIGRKRIERFAAVKAEKFRLRIFDSKPLPKIRSMEAFFVKD